MVVALLAVLLIALLMLAMSVGVLVSGRCLRWSCGGPEALGPDGESLLCADCPRRKDLAAEMKTHTDLAGMRSSNGAS